MNEPVEGRLQPAFWHLPDCRIYENGGVMQLSVCQLVRAVKCNNVMKQ